jgi:hypothetical protein
MTIKNKFFHTIRILGEILLSCALLMLAVFLLNLLVKETFTKYTNCTYLIVTRMGMDPLFCTGNTVKFLGTTIFTIPGLKGVMDPQLELVRKSIAWIVVIFFALVSFCLTIIVVNIKTLVRLISLNKDEWKKFMTNVRIWLLLFIIFCSGFYFAAIK